MSEYKISLETLNAVLAYLGSRPYQEVFNLIKSVQDEASKQVIAQVGDTNDGEPEQIIAED
jgi:hypothetical protein